MDSRFPLWCAALALTGALAACSDNRTDTSATPGGGTDSTAQNAPGDMNRTTPGDTTANAPGNTTTGSAGAPGASPDDAALAARVQSAIKSDTTLQDDDISVESAGGRVILSGKVDDAKDVLRATEVASSVDGVSSVENRLTAS